MHLFIPRGIYITQLPSHGSPNIDHTITTWIYSGQDGRLKHSINTNNFTSTRIQLETTPLRNLSPIPHWRIVILILINVSSVFFQDHSRMMSTQIKAKSWPDSANIMYWICVLRGSLRLFSEIQAAVPKFQGLFLNTWKPHRWQTSLKGNNPEMTLLDCAKYFIEVFEQLETNWKLDLRISFAFRCHWFVSEVFPRSKISVGLRKLKNAI